MDVGRLLLAATMLWACGKVDALSDANQPPPIDAAPCTGPGCKHDGDACAADSECTSAACACADATCATKLCSPTGCACGFNSTGAAACDGYIAAGHNDAEDSCGASACDGTGSCGLPLLWYKLDESQGASSIANSGTWPGMYATEGGQLGVSGMVGTALQLSQATDGITIAEPSDGSLDGFASWTVEGWVDLTTLPSNDYATLVKKDVAYICRIAQSGGTFYGQEIVWTPGQQSVNWTMPTAPVAGTWYHFACTYGAGTATVYWNGSAMMSTSGGGAALAPSVNVVGIGRNPMMGEELVGKLDDFKMWKTARTAQQICVDACGSYSGSTCTFDGVCGN